MNTKQFWILGLLLLAPSAEAAKSIVHVNTDGSITKKRSQAGRLAIRTGGGNIENPIDDPIDYPALEPIRMARGKVTINKGTVIVTEDSINHQVSQICEREVEIAVYDVRDQAGGYSWMPHDNVECSTLLENPQGLPSRIRLEANSDIWLTNWTAGERKSFNATLYAEGMPTNTDPFSDTFVNTREMGLDHLELQLSKIRSATRQVGNETRYQEIYATVEFIDEAASK